MDAGPSPIDWASWRAELHATLLFVVRDGEILLIRKKRGLGAGKINGPGGKLDPGETAAACAVRETEEELGIVARDPRKVGELWFAMSDSPDMLCHVYLSRSFAGVPRETDEAIPLWTKLDDIPYAEMWGDDLHWMPLMLDGRTFAGRFVFEGDALGWSEVEADVVWGAEAP